MPSRFDSVMVSARDLQRRGKRPGPRVKSSSAVVPRFFLHNGDALERFERANQNSARGDPPGHAYVSSTNGALHAQRVERGGGYRGGILIRALEPLEGIAIMQKNRGTTALLDLTRGPGRLAAALQITREHDGIDLTASQTLWLGELVAPSKETVQGAPYHRCRDHRTDRNHACPRITCCVSTNAGILLSADRNTCSREANRATNVKALARAKTKKFGQRCALGMKIWGRSARYRKPGTEGRRTIYS